MPDGKDAAIGCDRVVFRDCPKAFLMSLDHAGRLKLASTCITVQKAS
jgi:hypothetical protein